MRIVQDMLVSFAYELRDQHGELLDNSEISGPITYIHGHQSLLAPMERALEGRIQEEKFSLKIPCKEAYGEYRESSVISVPKSSFKHPEFLELGLQFEWTPESTDLNHEAEKILVFVKEIHDDKVVLDANHPLAGKDLHFDINVLTVREPTAEELEAIKED